jgi:hypothetical protein
VSGLREKEELIPSVFVISYRLGVFGFPGSPAANKNAGLMDIRLVYALAPGTRRLCH